ncbi:Protein of unknown function [Gryllus bimaculatus]|nr:Protein of unknown function [Gryllus bimaculatus]
MPLLHATAASAVASSATETKHRGRSSQ